MGQTLTHGVYLPDEGERNCYNGLASNWSILDGAVGTIAEHTTALAGKAPAVHTHTVSDITDFPAYGNAAGTICEGNDSRLSDARTPTAHTHTKSDVTDLLNSNFIPSANNSYDLGSSSYQWNNVYAKGYYYNGVAWGLDQINVWTNRNILESWGFTIRENSIADSTPPSSDVGRSLIEVWGSDSRYWGGFGYRWGANGVSELVISNSNWNGNTQGYWEYTIGVNKAFNSLYFKPPNGVADLGTSTNKWKTLNGINPGALSLLDYNNVLDVTSEVPVASLDGNANIDLNDYIPNKTGWLSIVIANTTGNFIKAVQGRAGTAAGFNATRTYHSGAADNEVISLFMPIIAGTWKSVYIKASSLIQMRFYYCLGNV